jgi:hypothetical protein
MDDDASLALTALIEGDAATGQLEYLFEHPGLIRDLQNEASDFDSSELDNAPAIFRETLLFPYDQGADFVDTLYREGGWEAVDAAYATRRSRLSRSCIPTSTTPKRDPSRSISMTLGTHSAASGRSST